MITLDQVKETLRQAAELLNHAPNEDAKKELKTVILMGQQVLASCERLKIKELTGDNVQVAEDAIRVVQELYNKHASN